MTDDTSPSPSAPAGRRDVKKDELRSRMLDALVAIMVERTGITHDAIAERVGVGRRTVYRYFPDRQSLMSAAWVHVQSKMGPQVVLPTSMEELIDTLEPVYTGLDKVADITTVIRTSPEGRALRLSGNARRQATYLKATADVVKDLPEDDRLLATAMFQMLHTTPWLEMRDHWGLSGQQIARATGWAIRAMLADLKARGGRALDAPLPSQD